MPTHPSTTYYAHTCLNHLPCPHTPQSLTMPTHASITYHAHNASITYHAHTCLNHLPCPHMSPSLTMPLSQTCLNHLPCPHTPPSLTMPTSLTMPPSLTMPTYALTNVKQSNAWQPRVTTTPVSTQKIFLPVLSMMKPNTGDATADRM